jgi:hypothetical protein
LWVVFKEVIIEINTAVEANPSDLPGDGKRRIMEPPRELGCKEVRERNDA